MGSINQGSKYVSPKIELVPGGVIEGRVLPIYINLSITTLSTVMLTSHYRRICELLID